MTEKAVLSYFGVGVASDPGSCCLLLLLSVDNMKTSLSGREPLNGAAEPGCNLLEIDVFDVRKSVRAKKRCNARGIETAGPTFMHFLKLLGPLRY